MRNEALPSVEHQEAPATKTWLGTGLLAALGASLCCITPLLAIVAGTSGIAVSFHGWSRCALT